MTTSEKFKKNLTIPNILTIIRIILNIPFAYFFLNQHYVEAVIVVVASGVSDMLDGMIARKFNQKSDLGSILDPIADKITLVNIVICAAVLFPDIIPIVIIMITKEFIMLLGGLYLLCKKIKPMPARWYGKLSTVVFYTCSGIIILLKAVWNLEILSLTYALMTVSVLFMMFALFNYTKIFLEKLNNQQHINSDIKMGSVIKNDKKI